MFSKHPVSLFRPAYCYGIDTDRNQIYILAAFPSHTYHYHVLKSTISLVISGESINMASAKSGKFSIEDIPPLDGLVAIVTGGNPL